MKAVCTDLEYVKSLCPPGVYRSVWDRLVDQLFGLLPVGMNAEEQIPDIDIWKDSVVLVSDEYPYTFNVLTDDEDLPKPGDAILYKGKYYIIGAVDAE